MSPEKQRIALARACGHHMRNSWSPWAEGPRGVYVVPDYLNDLNACHEAWVKCIKGDSVFEDAFTYHFEDAFTYHLGVACGCDMSVCSPGEISLSVSEIAIVSNATAAQRAEAILRTLNLWQEEPAS